MHIPNILQTLLSLWYFTHYLLTLINNNRLIAILWATYNNTDTEYFYLNL